MKVHRRVMELNAMLFEKLWWTLQIYIYTAITLWVSIIFSLKRFVPERFKKKNQNQIEFVYDSIFIISNLLSFYLSVLLLADN